jgi:hypothetical protein
MKRFSLPILHFPSQRPSTVSHLLDLKKKGGYLPSALIDLPATARRESWYLRQQSRNVVPASYRSGLAFFAMSMILGAFGIAALDAQTLATSHRNFLHAQIVQEFSELSEGIQPYVTDEEAPFFQLPDEESLSLFSDPLEQQSQLVTLGLEVRKGHEAFQEFLSFWKNEGNSLEKIRWMNSSAQKSLRVWDKVFSQLESFPFYQLDSGKREQFHQSLLQISELRTTLRTFTELAEPLSAILGKESPQRILVFLQDPHERRATGGALSAGMELLVEGGDIVSKRAFHVSELDEQMSIQIPPPTELTNLSSEWNIQTSNSFLDTPKSSQQMAWFWSRKARNSTDMIVYINSSALERLHLALPFSQDLSNFSLNWSALRLNGDREALKSLLSQTFDELLNTLNSPESFFQLLPELERVIGEKQILATSFTPVVQKAIQDLRLDGSLPAAQEHQDFLMVSSINTESNLSDRWVSEDLQLHTAISDDGIIRNWMRLERTHRWESGYLTPLLGKIGLIPSRNLLSLLSTAENKSVVKILVPKGTQLQSALGIDLNEISVSETESHTIWTFKNSVKAGASSSVELTYELPWRFDTSTVDNYRLHLVKQPGTNPMAFQHVLKLPSLMSVFQQLPEEPLTVWNQDERIAVVAGKNP